MNRTKHESTLNPAATARSAGHALAPAVLVGLAALLTAVASSRAATVSYPAYLDSVSGSNLIPEPSTPGSARIELNVPMTWQRFDPSLGDLTRIALQGSLAFRVELTALDPAAPASADLRAAGFLVNGQGILYRTTGFNYTNSISTQTGSGSVLGSTGTFGYIATASDTGNFAGNNTRFPFIGTGTNQDSGRPLLNPDVFFRLLLSNMVNVGSASLTVLGSDDSETPSNFSVSYDYTPAAAPIPLPAASVAGAALLASAAIRRRGDRGR